MKILYLHQHFTTRQGSSGTRSYEMAKALVAAGHEVHMVCGSFHAANTGILSEFKAGVRHGDVEGFVVTEFEIAYANAHGFTSRVNAFLKFAYQSTKLAMTEDYDLVFATSTPLTAGIPAIIAKFLRRKTFVFEVRDLWPELPKAMGVIKNPIVLMLMSSLEWLSYRFADACIGLSPGIVEGIKKRSSSQKNVALIPNGCDLDLFGASVLPSTNATPLVDKDKFTVAFSGTHGKANGLDAILDAAVEVQARGCIGIEFLFIGEGGEKERLIKRMNEENINNCRFESMVPKTELVRIFSQVDVGLMVLANVPAFYYGTSPNKFFDYISAGLPVINNYPGWVASIIEEDELGFVVPPGNPALFADAICTIANDADKRKVMGRNARKCAEKRFGRQDLAEKFVSFIEDRASV